MPPLSWKQGLIKWSVELLVYDQWSLKMQSVLPGLAEIA